MVNGLRFGGISAAKPVCRSRRTRRGLASARTGAPCRSGIVWASRKRFHATTISCLAVVCRDPKIVGRRSPHADKAPTASRGYLAHHAEIPEPLNRPGPRRDGRDLPATRPWARWVIPSRFTHRRPPFGFRGRLHIANARIDDLQFHGRPLVDCRTTAGLAGAPERRVSATSASREPDAVSHVREIPPRRVTRDRQAVRRRHSAAHASEHECPRSMS